MRTLEHTPGPWEVGEWNHAPCVTYPVQDGPGVQYWVPQNLHYLPGGAGADARLIAAAPELLNVCIELIEGYLAQDVDIQSLAKAAQAVIRKAYGESK